MILQVQSVPPSIAERVLPASEHRGQLAVVKGAGRELPVLEAEIHVLELDEHIELTALWGTEQQRGFGGCIRCLAHREGSGMMCERPCVHLLQKLVEARPIRVALVAYAERGTCRAAVWEAWSLGDHVDSVDPESIDAAIQPPVHHLVDSVAHPRVLPVQIRLLAGEQMQVILA